MNNSDSGFKFFRIGVAACFAVAASLGYAEEKTVKEGAKDVGRAAGSAAHEVKEGAKKVGKTIGHAAKEGVQAVKEGGREFKKAVKGEN